MAGSGDSGGAWRAEITPTPALSYAVRERKAAGGVMITSSHNPAEWNGVKYKASYGGSGKPSIMTAIESYLGKPLPKAATPAAIEEVDFNPDYIAAIARFVDLDAIRASGYKFLIDDMYGAGRGVIAGIFAKAGIPFVRDSRVRSIRRFRGSIRSRFCRISRLRRLRWSRRGAMRG